MKENRIRKLPRGLYMDTKTGEIGKLKEGKYIGSWYVKGLDELPDEIKKDMIPSYKKDNEINRQIKQYYSMADDYNKEIIKLERQKNIERRINGELSSKYKEIEDLQAHKERIERDYRNSALKLEDARQRQVMNNEFGIAIKEKELNNIKQTGKIETLRQKASQGGEGGFEAYLKYKNEGGKDLTRNEVRKLAKGEAYQNKNGVVVEIKDIDDKRQTTYSMQTNPTTPPSYKTFMEKDVKSMLDKNGYTKVKEGTPLQSMADQRVHDIEETLYNDKTMLDFAKKKKLNGVGGMTTQELENQIKQKEKYIRIAKGDKYLKEVDDRINNVGTHFAGEELYSDDPNRYEKTLGMSMKEYNEKMQNYGTAKYSSVKEATEDPNSAINNYIRNKTRKEAINKMSKEGYSDYLQKKHFDREGIYKQESTWNKMSLSELKAMAKDYGINTKMSKAKIISALISLFED